MRIDVELLKDYGRLLKREPVFICDEIFKLNLITNYQMGEFIAVFKNGDKLVTEHYSNIKELIIPSKVLTAGTLNITVTLLSFGVAIKKWEIEPLILKEADSGLEVFSPLEEMSKQIAAQADRIEALTDTVSALSLLGADLQKQIKELWEAQEC